MTKVTRFFGCKQLDCEVVQVPEVPHYSGHTKFAGHSYYVPAKDLTPIWHTEVMIEYGKIWEVPKGGKIELEWTDDLTVLNPDAPMNLISEAYE